MSKQWWPIINAVIIAVALIVIAAIVDEAEPWIIAAGFLNLVNVLVFSRSNRTKKQ